MTVPIVLKRPNIFLPWQSRWPHLPSGLFTSPRALGVWRNVRRNHEREHIMKNIIRMVTGARFRLLTPLFGSHKMKKRSLVAPTIFLQAVVVLIGIGTLVLMLWEPHLEGRNAHATPFEIYFNDPFLAYAYLASIPFFVALYQAFKTLGYIGRNKAFSQASVQALWIIKYCAFIMAGAIVAADAFLMIAARNTEEDAAGAVMLGIIATFVAIVVGTTAAVFERVLQSAVDMKSENDLTV